MLSGVVGVGTRFGSTCPEVCAHCHRAELKYLRYPRNAEDHMTRVMTITRTCKRCRDETASLKDLGIKTVDVTVCLPTGYVSDGTSFAMKHRASTVWGVKPSCADLQLINLACAARDSFRRRAYLTVGNHAICDELVFVAPVRWCYKTTVVYGVGCAASALLAHSVASPDYQKRINLLQFAWDGDDIILPVTYMMKKILIMAASIACFVRFVQMLARMKIPHHYPTAWTIYDEPSGEPREPRTEHVEPPPAEEEEGEEGEEPLSWWRNWFGPREDDVNPAEPDASVALQEAEAATVVEQQQRAYVENGVLRSTTTMTQEDRVEMVEPPGLEGGSASGARAATPRFPQITTKPNYLHSNNPKNLKQAHDKRNIGIGNHNPYVSEAKTRDALVEGLKEKVFNASKVKKAMKEFESMRASALPRKLTHEGKMKVEMDAMNTELRRDIVGFDRVIKAFVKSEVTAKDKPRGIANHGDVRLYALAKVAFAFEHVMFDVFQSASIKGRPKHKAIEEIFTNMSKMRAGARWVENDLTAFEFGISEPLKQIEQEIFLHIARLIGVEDVGDELFERVVEDRDKCATWRMTHKDATGEKKTAKIKIPQTMRESGDRVTSSGNFLQNLIAWFSFLVDPEHVGDALDCLIKFRGAKMFYVSPRDTELINAPNRAGLVRRKYLACLAFEGDDTGGRLEENVWARNEQEECPVSLFFTRWGWKAKLVWKPLQGDGYMRFVGYEALISDGEVVYDGGEMVMTPEVTRFLNTKSWTTTDVTPQELKTCIQIYAATLADGFTRVEPIHAFLTAIYDSNKGGCTVKAEKVREYMLARTGELPDAGVTVASVSLPGFVGGDSEKWKRLLRCSAGEFSDREWAEMSHVGSVDVHGADLALCVPAAWRG